MQTVPTHMVIRTHNICHGVAALAGAGEWDWRYGHHVSLGGVVAALEAPAEAGAAVPACAPSEADASGSADPVAGRVAARSSPRLIRAPPRRPCVELERGANRMLVAGRS